MYSEAVPLLLSASLVAAAAVALLSSKVSSSLISLFCCSIVLGAIFTLYGDSLVGLLQMITFAGAVSVLLLTVILMTGQSDLAPGARSWVAYALAAALAAGAVSAFAFFSTSSGAASVPAADLAMGVFGFIWQYRQWDLLILVMVFASSMVAVANLLSEEKE